MISTNFEAESIILDRHAFFSFISVHLYTGFGPRDRSDKEKEYHRKVYGPEAAEQGIEIARQLIEKARVAKGVKKPVKLAFDEWNGWDEELGKYIWPEKCECS